MTLFVIIGPGSAIGTSKTEGSARIFQVSWTFGFASTQGLGSNGAGEGWSFNMFVLDCTGVAQRSSALEVVRKL